jgi:AcrR family transcriptional regulator
MKMVAHADRPVGRILFADQPPPRFTTMTEPVPPQTTSSTSAQASTKRDAIVIAAVTCFSRDGFAGTTISAIAQQAKIGKGTVYEYFTSKEEILVEACLLCCQQNQTKVQELLGSAGQGIHSGGNDITKSIHRLMVTVFSVVPSGSQSYTRLFLDLWTVAASQPQVLSQAQSRLREVYAQWEGVITFLYGAGLAQGVFRPLPDPTILARLFTAIIDGLIWQLPFRTDRSPEVLARSAADCLLTLMLKDAQRPSDVFA